MHSTTTNYAKANATAHEAARVEMSVGASDSGGNVISSQTAPAQAFSGQGLFSPRHLAMASRVVFIILAVVAFVYLARAVVLPLLLACVAAMMLKAPVRWLVACHLPTPLAAAILVGFLVAAIGLGMIYLGRPAVDWLAAAPETLPRLKVKFHRIIRPAVQLTEAASSVGDLAAGDNAKQAQPVEVVKDNRVASTMFTWTGNILAGAGETAALIFLLLASGDLFMLKLVRVIPRLRDKKHAVEISREIQHSISIYLFSVSLINVGLGVAVGMALWAIGLPNALMWGGVAAFANFVPYIGPVLAVTSVGLAGLLAFDSLGRGLLPAAAYCLVHLVETNAITPLVLGRRFALNPVMIFAVLIFCVWMWGVIGALLAVPLLVIAKVICDRIPGLSSLSEFLSSSVAAENGPDAGSGQPPGRSVSAESRA